MPFLFIEPERKNCQGGRMGHKKPNHVCRSYRLTMITCTITSLTCKMFFFYIAYTMSTITSSFAGVGRGEDDEKLPPPGASIHSGQPVWPSGALHQWLGSHPPLHQLTQTIFM